MASLLTLTHISSLFFVILFHPTISHQIPQTHDLKTTKPHSVPPGIDQSCKATRFPDQCKTALSKSHLPNPPKSIDIIFASMQVSLQNLKTAQSMAKTVLDTARGEINRTIAGKNCLEFLSYSQYRLHLASSPQILPLGKTKAARTWISAALSFQYDCWSTLKYANTTSFVNQTMAFLDSLISMTSNSLGMIVSYDLFGKDTTHWRPPMTERSGFWEDKLGGGPGSGGGAKVSGAFPTAMQADAKVCKAGPGCYRTVQQAVNAAPDNLQDGRRRFVIYIKQGVYKEVVRVPLAKRNVVFLGDGMGKTVITGNLNAGKTGSISTYNTATVRVDGDGFMAKGITFENTAGPDVHQALAFQSTSDLSIVENCEFLGHQDTLCAHSLRQFYKSCRVEGTVDFIFGNAAAIFQDSTILVRPRQLTPEKGENNAVTAHGRTDPGQSTGLVFQNCVINGTDDYMRLYHQNPKVHNNYLGRPWKEYSRTVFIKCYLGELIRPEGWMPWSGDIALPTLFYGEFANSGPGWKPAARVKWSSQIPAEHVSAYSVQRFIQGDEWIPSDPKISP